MTELRAGREGRLRIVAVADADSFVKWSAALLDSIPSAEGHIALVRTPLTVSRAQEQSALDGTRFGAADVTRLSFPALAAWLAEQRPDAVVLAGRGPFVRLMMHEIDRVHPRPVVVVGLPGISIPAQRAAVTYRREADLFLVHSHREERAFADLAGRLGADVRFGLANLPFASPRPPVRGGTDLVFAAQAIVPLTTADRLVIADMLRRAAVARPDRRVVVKLRSRAGENETHHQRESYETLLKDRPANLVFSYAPMRAALASAEGLVTVSSTAAIEAIAAGVPVIALDTFGVSKENLNTVFRGSGLFGAEREVVAREFRHPAPGWLTQNYFHDPDEATWWDDVERLIAQRRRGLLPARVQPARAGGALRLAWDRKSVLGGEDRTVSGLLALAVGMPLRAAILARRRLKGSRGAGSWSDPSTDITVTPALRQEPLLRRGPVGVDS
jgi:hypothetical protein